MRVSGSGAGSDWLTARVCDDGRAAFLFAFPGYCDDGRGAVSMCGCRVMHDATRPKQAGSEQRYQGDADESEENKDDEREDNGSVRTARLLWRRRRGYRCRR